MTVRSASYNNHSRSYIIELLDRNVIKIHQFTIYTSIRGIGDTPESKSIQIMTPPDNLYELKYINRNLQGILHNGLIMNLFLILGWIEEVMNVNIVHQA